MSNTIEERQATWNKFLQRWPLETLGQMTLAQYAQAGDKHSFVNWLETGTDSLGSMWGGSSFKFGVYSRKDQTPKPDGSGLRYTQDYAWLGKYGDSPEAAFQKVLAIIVQVAKAARAGDLVAVEAADLGNVTKWKIAFLYQDPKNPCVLPIFKKESLQAIASPDKRKSCGAMHAHFMAQRQGQDLLAYGDQLWARIQAIDAGKLSTEEAYAFLANSEQFVPTKPVTKTMSGFRTESGLEIALALDNKAPTLYLSQGDWLDKMRSELTSVDIYAANRTRTGSIGDHAPQLAIGNPIVKVTVPTRAVLAKLCEVYEGGKLDDAMNTPVEKSSLRNGTPPLNQILFGPPGTGKTFSTVDAALEVLDPVFLTSNVNDRTALKRRFDVLRDENRVRFVTFHQSFSYEDFVEGIRADVESADEGSAAGVQYRIEPGVFVQICTDARRDKQLEKAVGIRDGATVWKLSIEESSSAGQTRAYCLANGEARIGWPITGDLSNANLADPALNLGLKERKSLENFSQEIVVGDVVVCLASRTTIGAVGVVTGKYEYTKQVPPGVREDYVHRLPIQWLATDLSFDVVQLNQGKQLTLQTVYPLGRIQWPDLLAALTAAKVSLKSVPQTPEPERLLYVLVIDEINRGNVSRIFGELITLLEPSKRADADEALEVVLPYSKSRFSVPKNVYVIGTMNTADRSLAGLDVALRRRFVFKEMLPRPDLLKDVVVGSVNIPNLLAVMNLRIEALLDREHCIGHAYFMPLKKEASIEKLAEIFKNQVLPLLQEYFFDDWQRIQWVLNDHRKADRAHQFIQAEPLNTGTLFGNNVNVSHRSQTWRINRDAFLLEQSYLGVLNTTAEA